MQPGLIANVEPGSGHVLTHFDMVRLIDIFLLGTLDDDTDGRGIKYLEIAYLAAQIENSRQPELNR